MGGAGRAYKPVTHGCASMPRTVPAPPGNKMERRRRVVEGVLFFFRTRIDRSGNRVILFMCPHSVGVSSSFPRARGRGPTPYK